MQNTFKKISKKTFLIITVVAVLSIIGFYFFYAKQYVSTDDAYINANVVQIAPRVSGQVTRLQVSNNQLVHKNQLLFELDQTPFNIALNQAKAGLAMAEADLIHSQITTTRTEDLVKKRALPSQSHDDAVAKLRNAIAGVDLTKAAYEQTKLNLFYSRVIAPTNGWITNMSLREGDVITMNQPLFALISTDEFWVDANFKETELKNLRPGQTAKIVVDMYPNHPFSGVIESISGGSGAAFSLLPPQNATGNWVKITQRVPVKVLITNVDMRYPLRIGTTATVTVNTARNKT